VKPLRVTQENEQEREDRPSQRPTLPPAGTWRRTSGIRRRPEELDDDHRRTTMRVPNHATRVDVRWVPLVINRTSLAVDPPPLIASLLVACMNGVLSIADLSEVTGVPLGAVMDNVLDLVRRGVVMLETRTV